MQRTAIMGFGNPCRSDDAVGIYVIEALQKHLGDREDISVFDMGTGAFEVLYKLHGHQRIMIVDAVVDSGEPVGTLFEVPAEEVRRAPMEDPMVFLHSIKWDQALSYAKKILQDAYPVDIVVYLVSVDNTKLPMKMSEPVKQAGDKLINLLLEKMALKTTI
jgi:hydrogenase maturation protease